MGREHSGRISASAGGTARRPTRPPDSGQQQQFVVLAPRWRDHIVGRFRTGDSLATSVGVEIRRRPRNRWCDPVCGAIGASPEFPDARRSSRPLLICPAVGSTCRRPAQRGLRKPDNADQSDEAAGNEQERIVQERMIGQNRVQRVSFGRSVPSLDPRRTHCKRNRRSPRARVSIACRVLRRADRIEGRRRPIQDR